MSLLMCFDNKTFDKKSAPILNKISGHPALTVSSFTNVATLTSDCKLINCSAY
jgi:hypothetical protein